ncbi:MAG: phosphatase PAP2 family protein [Micropruina sp.]|nr:phosphatase PAP2 family protein [Micropruina sp.]
MSVLSRYRDDESAPTLRGAGRDLIFRALLPTLALFLVGLGVGWVVTGPFSAWTGEDQLSVLAQAQRTPALDEFARTASEIGSVNGNILLCIIGVGLVWAFTRRWWLAALPAVALILHVLLHLFTSILVGRERPDVEKLDIGQPTHSFPSGHMGATTAQLVVLALLFCLLVGSRAWRIVVITVVTAYLLVLGWSRVYLGMHHVTDVLWGAVNGVVCGLIAWLFLRRETAEPGQPSAAVRSVRGARG